MKRFIQIILLAIPYMVSGQNILSGTVVDTYTKIPVEGADVIIQGTSVSTTTDNLGHFSLMTGIDDITDKTDFNLIAVNNHIYWSTNKKMDFYIVNILGSATGMEGKSLSGSGEIGMENCVNGIYLLTVTGSKNSKTYKIIKNNNRIYINNNNVINRGLQSLKSTLSSSDTIVISKNGFYIQKYAFKNDNVTYELLKSNYDDLEYLDNLISPYAYVKLQGLPLNPAFGEVKSVKVIYSITDDKIYFSNSAKYNIHYDFCTQVLGYSKGHETFNQEQYSKNVNRIYILASLNHFTASDIYTLEFFAGDELDCSDIKTVYDKVTATTFIGNKLRFYANSTTWATCENVRVISSDELYKGQNYQPLNPESNYGYLKKVDINDLSSTYLGRHDIVLLNGIPVDISVVAGIITTDFQTPLSHVNVLSHNRGTPNMALRDGWTNEKLNNLLGKLVYLKVTLDSFYIREATLSEAEFYWAQKEPQTPHILELDTTTSGLIELADANVNSVKLIGGKAANFAEMTKINVAAYGPLQLPEGYFAIPFHYYYRHMKKYGLDTFINNMLNDPLFQTNIDWRRHELGVLQDSIKNSPLDTALLRLVKEHVSTLSGFTRIRFRSSTNAEDIEGFNGAGLYDSYSGSLTDPERPIDKAIKKVWASLWNFGAFEERDYFKIDHKTIAMGILVHRSFPNEAANGVAITRNLYNPYLPGITINVQIGEISVVNPEEKYLPDQIIYYTYYEGIEYINHSNVPGMEGKTVMTDAELKVLKDYCIAIHYHYCMLNFECKPLDIEFKVDIVNGERIVYVKQARLY